MFEIIVIIYCLVGIFLNVLLIPRKNQLIYEQNQYILERYKHMEKVINDAEQLIKEYAVKLDIETQRGGQDGNRFNDDKSFSRKR